MWVANAHNLMVIGELGEGALSPMACIIARNCSHGLISGTMPRHKKAKRAPPFDPNYGMAMVPPGGGWGMMPGHLGAEIRP